jgi:transcriptional regulator with XRE-family HTH domain
MLDAAPFMCRRARLIKGYTQQLFAEEMDVDPATVSRWECGKLTPSPSVLSRIREISRRAEPAHSDAYILSSPTMKYLCKLEDFSVPILLSKGLLETLGVTLEEVLTDPDSLWVEDSDGHRVNDTVQADPRWLGGEIAFFEAIHKASIPGESRWWHSIGAPIAESGAMLWEGVLDPTPNEFWIKLTPFSEIT